ncbi:MAG: YqgE/AlgH family protein, partial [Glaciimonas sp.]|nr:YqgE/AlgH family protein [Glaciimonas sp.]
LLERIDLKLATDDPSAHMSAVIGTPPSRSVFHDTYIPISERQVMYGGPVQSERGFVLHSPPTEYSSTVKVSDQIAITFSKDVLEEVAHAIGPTRMLVSIGCASWTAGQLENEIARNDWLTVAADPEIIFQLPIDERFIAAIRLLGIDPYLLSMGSGHA